MNIDSGILFASIAVLIAVGLILGATQLFLRETLTQRFIEEFPDDPSHRAFLLWRRESRWRAIKSQLDSLPAHYGGSYRKSRQAGWVAWSSLVICFVLFAVTIAQELRKPLPVSDADCIAPAAPK